MFCSQFDTNSDPIVWTRRALYSCKANIKSPIIGLTIQSLWNLRNLPVLLKTLFWLYGAYAVKKNLSKVLELVIIWSGVNALTEPAHFNKRSQPH